MTDTVPALRWRAADFAAGSGCQQTLVLLASGELPGSGWNAVNFDGFADFAATDEE